MDKKNVIAIILGVLLIALLGFKFYLDSREDTKDNTKSSDIVKFKQEYESLNGTKNDSDKEYLDVNISDKASIYYKTDEEIVQVLEKGTGVIYFGFNTCPWCRSMIETLINTAVDNKITDLYYVDVKDIRSSYSVVKKELKKDVLGTEGYYKILELLDDELTPYKITEGKKEYDTNEKRLYAPTVVVVKNGEIVGFHEGTVDSQEDPYLGLNDDEKEEIAKIFEEMFSKIKNSTCKDKAGC